MTSSEERTWSILAHLSGLLAYVTGLGHLIAPLVIWLAFKESSPRVSDEAKEALNFQISMTIYGIIAGILCFVLVGFLLLPLVVLVQLILPIVAAVQVSNGRTFRYPLTLRLVS